MIDASNFLHLPYTADLSQGGIAWALHSLPHAYTYHRAGSSPYDGLRQAVARGAVELAFRRYLAEQGIPFEIKGAAPFTEPDRYDVILGGRRCDIKTFLISHREQLSQIRGDPQALLRAPALVASDQHAGTGHSRHDLYLFAFLSGLLAASIHEQQKAVEAGQPYYLVHVMPETWSRPAGWRPLGRLVLKSESDEKQTVELAGHDRGRGVRSCTVELPARTRVELETDLFSLIYLHIKASPAARIGIHAPMRHETHLIGALEWGNIWVYGLEILLAGYMPYEEFRRRASFLSAGAPVFQYPYTHEKSLSVPVSDLRPLAELFERMKSWRA